MDEQMLTAREVAQRLSTTVSTVNRLVARGALTPIRLTPGPKGHRRFKLSDVLLFMESTTAGEALLS
jgi:excisionase family DNA binding protein